MHKRNVTDPPITEASTHELVEELKKREGVEATMVRPYESKQVDAQGPAIVLKVID